MLPNRRELREEQRRQGERQVVPKHPQRVRQVQEQQPIDYFGRVQEPMPIGRFHQLEQQLEGECYCN